MKFKIVVDSASDLNNNYIKDNQIGFDIVPLTIRVQGKEFLDDENLDIDDMLDRLSKTTEKPSTSCPSPYSWTKCYEDAEYVIAITISSKLSGTFNAAYLGAIDATNSKVHVIDSKGTAGMEVFLVDKAYELIKQNLSFEEICENLDNYQKSLELFFVLNKFDNLVKNGRMSRFTALIATTLQIKPLCVANDGEIKVYEKLRTMRAAIRRLASAIGERVSDTENRKCIISHVKDEETAVNLKSLIEEQYHFKEVIIRPCRGLCSFYALEKGIIVSF